MKCRYLGLLAVLMSGYAARGYALSLPDSCGKDEVQFKVKVQKNQPALPAADSGKAQLVFVQVLKGTFAGAPVTRLGVDGTWVGAVRGGSYFTVAVEPGVHHLCAVRQSGARLDKENAGIVTLTAEPGKSYAYSFTITREPGSVVGISNGGGTPGNVGGSNMTAKEGESVDSVALATLDAGEATSREKTLPVSSFSLK